MNNILKVTDADGTILRIPQATIRYISSGVGGVYIHLNPGGHKRCIQEPLDVVERQMEKWDENRAVGPV